LAAISNCLGINTSSMSFTENEAISTDKLHNYLQANTDITHLALVHCETSSGVLNPLEAIAELCKQHGIKLFVDAMSSFGGIPIDIKALNLACLMASANKCIESVPGIAFVIAQKTLLDAGTNAAKSYSLDLYRQWQMLQT